MEYNEMMKGYWQEQKDADARTVFANLRLELGCRPDNEHVGSGLGGNPTEFLFLLMHSVICIGIDLGDPVFEDVGGLVYFRSPKKPLMKSVRVALTKFLDTHYPDRIRATQEQLMNPSFLKDLGCSSMDMKLLIQALEHTSELVKWLDLKLEMQNKLHELSGKEVAGLTACFLKEQGLPQDYFEVHKNNKKDPMSRMLNRHPVWGTKIRAVHKRYGEMVSQLISPEDNLKLEMVGAFPQYIALFAFRSLVNIERIVALNLDELPSCKFLSEINKEMTADPKDEEGDFELEDEE